MKPALNDWLIQTDSRTDWIHKHGIAARSATVATSPIAQKLTEKYEAELSQHTVAHANDLLVKYAVQSIINRKRLQREKEPDGIVMLPIA